MTRGRRSPVMLLWYDQTINRLRKDSLMSSDLPVSTVMAEPSGYDLASSSGGTCPGASVDAGDGRPRQDSMVEALRHWMLHDGVDEVEVVVRRGGLAVQMGGEGTTALVDVGASRNGFRLHVQLSTSSRGKGFEICVVWSVVDLRDNRMVELSGDVVDGDSDAAMLTALRVVKSRFLEIAG